MKPLDLQGWRFGRLVAVAIDYEGTAKRVNQGRRWWCVCDCGNIVSVRAHYLIHGETRSCGCLARETKLRPKTIANKKKYIHIKPPSAVEIKYGCSFCADKKGCDWNCKYADFLDAYGSYAAYDKAAEADIYKVLANYFENKEG